MALDVGKTFDKYNSGVLVFWKSQKNNTICYLLVCIWEKCKGDCNGGGDLKNTLFIVKDVPIWVLQNSLLLHPSWCQVVRFLLLGLFLLNFHQRLTFGWKGWLPHK